MFALFDEVERLKLQVRQLQDEIAESKRTATTSLFRLENIKEKGDLVKFYTGFSDYVTLVTFYEQVLESDAEIMRHNGIAGGPRKHVVISNMAHAVNFPY